MASVEFRTESVGQRPVPSLQQRLSSFDWQSCTESIWQRGYAQLPQLLIEEECKHLIALYADDSHFRSHIVMSRYRFGQGDYKYFRYPLPPVVQTIRELAYPALAEMANRWNVALGWADKFPSRHVEFIKRCRKAGQTKPTPLLLHYETGDYNCLHQDIYGGVVFPLQMTVFLSRIGADYEGGEFVLVEQQPRAQSRAEVITPGQGEIVVFTTRYRPVQGSRGYYRVNVRHGVSRVKTGSRYTLGIIFHDAE